jgi:peptidoglycan hydrolase-like protein with peptidoglycan-binding domain
MAVMPLASRLFTDPPNADLEACLVDDAAHILTGADGPHVACIQIALSLLSDGAVFLVIDGIYGQATASAVFDYKNARQILGPGQVTPDDIVGKRTLQSLDDEMSVFEEQSTATDEFVSTTVLGSPHDHSACPFSGFSAPGSGGRVNHFGLPVNPLPGRSINIGGEHETDYLGFQDFVTEVGVIGPPRPLTASLSDHSVQNICLRDSPITMHQSTTAGRDEIRRIAAPGCRLTFCGDVPQFRAELLSLGTVDRQFLMADPRFRNPPTATAEALVITMP